MIFHLEIRKNVIKKSPSSKSQINNFVKSMQILSKNMQLMRVFLRQLLLLILLLWKLLRFKFKILRIDYFLFKREVKELILSLFQIPDDMLLLKATPKKLPIVSYEKYICFSTATINFKPFVKTNCVIYAGQKLNLFRPFFIRAKWSSRKRRK